MEYLILFGALIAFYLFVVIQGKLSERKIKKYFITRLKKEYNRLRMKIFNRDGPYVRKILIENEQKIRCDVHRP